MGAPWEAPAMYSIIEAVMQLTDISDMPNNNDNSNIRTLLQSNKKRKVRSTLQKIIACILIYCFLFSLAVFMQFMFYTFYTISFFNISL